jgi:hypothetical protein
MRAQSTTRRFARPILFTACLAACFGPAVTSGCGGGFDAPSKLEGLRVLGVVADKPYAKPGDEVTFKMSYEDGFVDPQNPDAGPRKVQITWLGGCIDPIGDLYFGCYASLANTLQQIASGQLPPDGLVAQGVGLDQFTIKLPADIVSQRPKPEAGPHYGLTYVFFAACAGTVKPVGLEGTGRAGSFPLGCFDENGNRLGADSFVPGYTQVYAFEDERVNTNPKVKGVLVDGVLSKDDPNDEIPVAACTITEDQRNAPPGCSKQDPFSSCQALTLDVDVDQDVAEVDPDAKGSQGETLREAVWVDYYADAGDFQYDIKLVSDPITGLTDDHTTKWIAPEKSGLVSLWITVHDARGGATVLKRTIKVQ